MLTAWKTPFAATLFPEVVVIPAADVDNAGMLLVRTSNLEGNAPSTFAMRFDCWVGVKWEDESVAPNHEWAEMARSEARLCTYYWKGSPWIRRFEASRQVVEAYYGTLTHFIVFGGNKNVEVLAPREPQIERIDDGDVISMSYCLSEM